MYFCDDKVHIRNLVFQETGFFFQIILTLQSSDVYFLLFTKNLFILCCIFYLMVFLESRKHGGMRLFLALKK